MTIRSEQESRRTHQGQVGHCDTDQFKMGDGFWEKRKSYHICVKNAVVQSKVREPSAAKSDAVDQGLRKRGLLGPGPRLPVGLGHAHHREAGGVAPEVLQVLLGVTGRSDDSGPPQSGAGYHLPQLGAAVRLGNIDHVSARTVEQDFYDELVGEAQQIFVFRLRH